MPGTLTVPIVPDPAQNFFETGQVQSPQIRPRRRHCF